MKRAEALRPLSRDHHQALVVAQRLRRAEDPDEAAASFLEFWKGDGRPHFRIEEEVLLPLWRLLGSADEAAAARLAREHLALRTTALALASHSPSLEEVRSLGDRLDAHIRFEERELFPLIEADLDTDGLTRLAGAVSEAEQS